MTGVMFPFASTAEMAKFVEERHRAGSERPDYARNTNPTRRAAECKLTNLEAAGTDLDVDTILTSSGMAAVNGLLLYVLKAGDHLVLSDSLYRVTCQFACELLTRFGVEVSLVETGCPDALEHAVRSDTAAILVESPSNPFNYCTDLEHLARIGRRCGAVTIVDSTFATPYNCKPLVHGIDFVIHSVTKYLAGHNDLMAGSITGDLWEIAGLRGVQTQLGCVLDSHTAYSIIRGLKTFGLRMARHNANAQALAEMLECHPKVGRVWYAGLESHPQHLTAIRFMEGFGGVVSFDLGDHETAAAVNDRLQLAMLGGSLGATETLVHQPWLLSHFDQTATERKAIGIGKGLIRVACGIEDTDDLLADFRQALEAA